MHVARLQGFLSGQAFRWQRIWFLATTESMDIDENRIKLTDCCFRVCFPKMYFPQKTSLKKTPKMGLVSGLLCLNERVSLLKEDLLLYCTFWCEGASSHFTHLPQRPFFSYCKILLSSEVGVWHRLPTEHQPLTDWAPGHALELHNLLELGLLSESCNNLENIGNNWLQLRLAYPGLLGRAK